MPTFDELVERFSYLAATPAVAVVFLTAAVLVAIRDRRLLISAFALQSVFAGLLFTRVLPAQIAGAKLITGLLISVLYFVTAQQMSRSEAASTGEQATSSTRISWQPEAGLPFRIFAVVMVGVVGWQLANDLDLGIPGLEADVILATILLVGLGLLLLGLTDEPFKAGLGLLTVLTGFELFYASVEPALAVMALLAAVDFSVALGSSYLAIIGSLRGMEETPLA